MLMTSCMYLIINEAVGLSVASSWWSVPVTPQLDREAAALSAGSSLFSPFLKLGWVQIGTRVCAVLSVDILLGSCQHPSPKGLFFFLEASPSTHWGSGYNSRLLTVPWVLTRLGGGVLSKGVLGDWKLCTGLEKQQSDLISLPMEMASS